MNKPKKLSLHTPSLADENFAALVKLFPNAVTETIDENGAVVRAIDADALAQEINTHVVSGREERFQFTWPDKKKSVLLANEPIKATLRPCQEESVDFDNTENLYIEGDNLDVLKLLRETYLNKVKMIYIDPPYNTGNDFVYEDDYAEETGEFRYRDGQYDEQGNRLVKNLDSNGRFHTDWLNMIYPRLRVARDLLTDDGVIFISIDDNECHNLRKVCDEIFGSSNFVTEFAWEKKKKPSFLHKNIGKLNDYILCYVKNAFDSKPFSVETTTKGKKYPLNNAGNGLTVLTFPAGYIKFNIADCTIEPQDMSEGAIITKLLDPVKITNSRNVGSFRLEGEWRYSQSKLDEIITSGEEVFISKYPFRPNHVKSGGEIKKMKNVFSPAHYQMETNEDATSQLTELFGSVIFDNPKPIKLLCHLAKAVTYDSKDSIVLDFFSGSATTAHSIMQLNAEDGGKRKFIMVQIPEPCAPDSEATGEGFSNISEIGKERIRRAGKKIKEESPLTTQDLDVGFRVLKLDSTNMKDVYYTPEEYAQMNYTIEGFADNIKPDRTDEDLLFHVMLDMGIPLSAKIRQEGRVFYVEGNYLIACFGKVDTDLITEIAKKKPYYAVFRDSSIADDSAMVNFEQVFTTYSLGTIRRVL